MSGRKNVSYELSRELRLAMETRRRNARNKKKAQSLIKELKNSIEEAKKKGADKFAKEQLEKAEKLCKTIEDTIASGTEPQNYEELVKQEEEIKQTCEDLEAGIIEGMTLDRKWSAPLKNLFRLKRKIGSLKEDESSEANLLLKWKKDSFEKFTSEFDELKTAVENKSGDSENAFYRLQDMLGEYDALIEEANNLEGKSINREMLIKRFKSAFESPEINFNVKVKRVDKNNPQSALVLQAWRPGDEQIQMRFELDDPKHSINTLAGGFPGVTGHSSCSKTLKDVGDYVDGINVRLQQYGEQIFPDEQDSFDVPEEVQRNFEEDNS